MFSIFFSVVFRFLTFGLVFRIFSVIVAYFALMTTGYMLKPIWFLSIGCEAIFYSEAIEVNEVYTTQSSVIKP